VFNGQVISGFCPHRRLVCFCVFLIFHIEDYKTPAVPTGLSGPLARNLLVDLDSDFHPIPRTTSARAEGRINFAIGSNTLVARTRWQAKPAQSDPEVIAYASD
jgi:hypothetical protein